MQRWHAEYAWLGGADLTADVVVTATDGTISDVSTGAADPSAVSFDGVLLPGLASAHSHAFHRALRGRTSKGFGDFWSWREPMYAIAGSLTPDSYKELAAVVFSEMLAAGITAVGEFHYLHHRPDGTRHDQTNAMGLALVEAAQDVGIRLTLIDTAYTASDITGAEVLPQQRRFTDGSVAAWSDRVRDLVRDIDVHPNIRLGVAAHSVRAVSESDLSIVAETANQLDSPLHIHMSEQAAENDAVLNEFGISPTQLLARSGFLTARTTLIHATHLTDTDIDTIAFSGAGVCFCPTTEADLGDGIGPAAELAAHGVAISLGSDSNAVIDILAESRRLEHHDRLRLERRGIHTPIELLGYATSNGYQALGWPEGGRIAVGAPADLIVIDPTTNELAGTDIGRLDGIAMAATRASVTDVIVNGEHVVVSGNTISGPQRDQRLSALRALWDNGDFGTHEN